MQQEEVVEKKPDEVSTSNTNSSVLLQTNPGCTSVRKRLTTPYNGNSNTKYALLYTKSRTRSESTASGSSETENKNKSAGKKYKIYPFKNRSAEEFRVIKNDTFNRKSSSVDSSDCELDNGTFAARRRQKNVAYKSEEKSQLICYKDHTKILSIKNDSKVTKYNTFDLKPNDKPSGKLIKYKSLDEPSALIKYQDTQVKYKDTRSNVSISAQDFDLTFKLTKFDQRPKSDIITNTVDSWAKKSTKNVFSNIRNSLFKNSNEKAVVFKPLIFGGTFPIDAPMDSEELKEKIAQTNNEKRAPLRSSSHRMLLNDPPKVREYGAPKTFDIDRPI